MLSSHLLPALLLATNVAAYRPGAPMLRPQGSRPQLKLVAADEAMWPERSVWLQQAGAMWIAAALLGPVCDGRHSAHDVLHYATDSIAGPPWIFQSGGQVLLETCWWVPVAFGGAGVVLGAAHPFFDREWGGAPRPPPGWPLVLFSISCFVACYDLSGALAQAAAEESGGAEHLVSLDLPLFACACATFLAFERSRGGLLMMALLGSIGPAVEIGLINQLHLYAYTHPDFLGIPSWIPWVYAAGGPANGALGRQILHELEKPSD
jgi:hypothetical protein|eukprot:Transcript_25427.p1 GENE.Transcript_25427~~Transcript_25427.p1  ORF type:complete len:264 (-),score=59.57 Transcript_25427:61-852(-)